MWHIEKNKGEFLDMSKMSCLILFSFLFTPFHSFANTEDPIYLPRQVSLFRKTQEAKAVCRRQLGRRTKVSWGVTRILLEEGSGTTIPARVTYRCKYSRWSGNAHGHDNYQPPIESDFDVFRTSDTVTRGEGNQTANHSIPLPVGNEMLPIPSELKGVRRIQLVTDLTKKRRTSYLLRGGDQFSVDAHLLDENQAEVDSVDIPKANSWSFQVAIPSGTE